MKRGIGFLMAVWIVAASGRVGLISSARATEKAPRDQPPLVKLVLHPAPEPRPALKYRLLPDVLELRPGNAAVMYNKLCLVLSQRGPDDKNMDKICDWIQVSPAELPRKEVREALSGFRTVFEGLDLAARRDHCDWQLPLGEVEDAFAILLPEFQNSRQFARLLTVQARLQTVEGKLDDALHTLQTNYALGRHVGTGKTLVSGLVGLTICNMASADVELLIQQPEAPNLYWALTELPHPLVDMRPAVEMEMHMLDLSFPELRHVEDTQRSPPEWQALLDRMSQKLLWAWSDGAPGKMPQLTMTALALKGYPTAKRGLIEMGYPAQQVEAMPVPQVLILYTVRTYQEFRDDMFKWFGVPYPEARAGMNDCHRRLETEAGSREVVPLASLLLPAVGAVQQAVARTERKIAVLRVIEALRLYAAGHEGRLPEKLDDVTQVPIPPDPMTGQPFVYRRTGETALLEAPAPAGLSSAAFGLRYEIKIAR
jgi:hypothetical protein